MPEVPKLWATAHYRAVGCGPPEWVSSACVCVCAHTPPLTLVSRWCLDASNTMSVVQVLASGTCVSIAAAHGRHCRCEHTFPHLCLHCGGAQELALPKHCASIPGPLCIMRAIVTPFMHVLVASFACT